MKKLFGDAVQARRKQLGLSQEKLAEKAAMHRTYVSDVERGMRNISLDNIVKLALALEMPVAALFQPQPSLPAKESIFPPTNSGQPAGS